ncbi:MAG: hypothetical protein Q8L71_12240 [Thiobacillus sp.]|nr:hypothetical protein [Thiobacillus sp.]
MDAALIRRYHKGSEENGMLPSLLLIDDSKGQIAMAVEAMAGPCLGGSIAARCIRRLNPRQVPRASPSRNL